MGLNHSFIYAFPLSKPQKLLLLLLLWTSFGSFFFFFFVFRLPFFFPLLDFTPSIVNVHKNMVYGTKKIANGMEYISITFRDHRRKRKRVPRREKQTKKKGLEGESRRKMSIPTGSDPPISVYMIIYYVRMSICL